MASPQRDVVDSAVVEKIVSRAYVETARPQAMAQIRRMLGDGPFAKVFLFISGGADFAEIIRAARQEFGDTQLSACTTAGEISPDGYCEGGIVAVGLPSSYFAVRSILVENLNETNQDDLIGRFIRNRHDMANQHPTWESEFVFAMIDGLSTQEEVLLRALTPGLGGIPLFGGSAGDGIDFDRTWVAYNGQVHENAAIINLVRTRCPIKVFSVSHFSPADHVMVVTKANPEKRTVSEINAEPALVEYARALGIPPEQVGSHTFAANPLVVRIGDANHVRGILRGEEDGALEFASAIDVGLVLRSTEAGDIESNLKLKLASLAETTKPDVVLACDCLWRRIEISDRQSTSAVSAILSKNRVIGFNTYGEQIDALHVNHTMTGIAIYPPQADL